MRKITVNVAELRAKIDQLQNDKMDYVRLFLVDAEHDGDTLNPGFIHIDAFSKDGHVKDYESIDSVEPVTELMQLYFEYLAAIA